MMGLRGDRRGGVQIMITLSVLLLLLLNLDDFALRLLPDAISLFLGEYVQSAQWRVYSYLVCSDITGDRKAEQMGSNQLLQMYTNSLFMRTER